MKLLLAAICAASLASQAVVQYALKNDRQPSGLSYPSPVDYRGRNVCDAGWIHYRGWCWLDPKIPYFQYPMSEYVPPEMILAKWNEAGSAVCPEGFDYAGDNMCLPQKIDRGK
jgi:hypothetical protein